MKRTSLLLFLVTLSLAASTAAGEEIRWQHDLRAAAKMASDTQRPMIVHFYADWCGPCVRLDRVVFKDPHLVRSLNEDVIAVKVNVDAHPEIANHFGVNAVPTDVYLSLTGQFIAIHNSPKAAVEYRSLIQQLKAYTQARKVARRGAP